MTTLPPPPGHLLVGYTDVLVLRSARFRTAARWAARHDLHLHCWRWEEDPKRVGVDAAWSDTAEVPGLERLKVFRREIAALADQFGVTRIRVFGSAARGTERAGSDIDLLVDVRDGYSALQLAGFAAGVSELAGRPVDVATEEFLRPEVLARALTDAVELLEAPPSGG